MSVIESLFVTKYRNDGSHSPMTLTEWASQFLADIERLFGPRDRSFTLVGIDIDRTPGNSPRVWFPDSGIAPGDVVKRSKHIIIRLGPNALNDPVCARWQLAHECVHLLDPWHPGLDGGPTNMLEEGLATWYQNNSVREAVCHEGAYATAEKLVEALMPELPKAVKRIREERNIRIGGMNSDILRDYCPGMDRDISRKLCEPFRQEES